MTKPGDAEELDEGLGELDEDESSVRDEPDPEGAFDKRRIFTDKTDMIKVVMSVARWQGPNLAGKVGAKPHITRGR